MASSIETAIWSAPEEDHVYVEFRCAGDQFASLCYRNQMHVLELYPRSDGQAWVLNVDEFIEQLQRARASLTFRSDKTPHT